MPVYFLPPSLLFFSCTFLIFFSSSQCAWDGEEGRVLIREASFTVFYAAANVLQLPMHEYHFGDGMWLSRACVMFFITTTDWATPPTRRGHDKRREDERESLVVDGVAYLLLPHLQLTFWVTGW